MLLTIFVLTAFNSFLLGTGVTIDTIFQAAQSLLSWQTFLLVGMGALIGVVGGALPGISASVTIALVLPLTFTLDASSALVFLGSLYMAAVYGGSVAAILINTPGTPAAIVTALDGHPMARQGRAREALYTAILGSSIGGVVGVLVLLFFTPPLAAFSLRFNAAEMFWLAVAGLAVVCNLTAKDFAKGVIAASFGLWLATVGEDPAAAFPRFAFGSYQMAAGLPLVPMLLGFFAISEMLRQLGVQEGDKVNVGTQPGTWRRTLKNVITKPILLLRSAIIGVVVGILPGAGASIAGFVSYGEAKRFSKSSETFGEGNPEGVLASEVANNAMVGGSLVPLLAFGIPGSASAAVLFGALTINGLVPGPNLFVSDAPVVYTFILGFLPAILAMFAFGTLATPLYSAVLNIRTAFIIPSVLLLAFIGSYSVRGELFDVWLASACGLVGFFMLKFKFNLAPIILGVVLGPLIEDNFQRSLLLGNAKGSVLEFLVSSPISIVLILVTLAMVASAFWQEVGARRKRTVGVRSGEDNTGGIRSGEARGEEGRSDETRRGKPQRDEAHGD